MTISAAADPGVRGLSFRSVMIDRRPHEIEIVTVSPREWRAIDRTLEEREGAGFLGTVRCSGDLWEVARLGFPRTFTYWGSWDEAVSFLCHER